MTKMYTSTKCEAALHVEFRAAIPPIEPGTFAMTFQDVKYKDRADGCLYEPRKRKPCGTINYKTGVIDLWELKADAKYHYVPEHLQRKKGE